MDIAKLLTTEQAADYLDVKVSAIYVYRQRGQFPPPTMVVGRQMLWSIATLDRWKAKRTGRGVGGGRPVKTAKKTAAKKKSGNR